MWQKNIICFVVVSLSASMIAVANVSDTTKHLYNFPLFTNIVLVFRLNPTKINGANVSAPV